MSAVAAILEREIDAVTRFIALLKDEQACLTAGNPEPLPRIADLKSRLVEELNSLEADRMSALGHAGAPSDRHTMTRWLNENASDPVTTVNWENLQNLAIEAKALHETNSQLVEMHLKNTSEALAILTEQASSSTLYGATGQTLSSTGSRIVDSA